MKRIAPIALMLISATCTSASAASIGDERAITGHLDEAAIADGRIPIEQVLETGRIWFTSKFTTLDGAGRPGATTAIIPTRAQPGTTPMFFRTAGPDSTSCASCHMTPSPGGAGDFVANAFVSEGFSDTDFDTVNPQFSSERGTVHLFGSGLVELLGREMTRELRHQRDVAARKARTEGKAVRIVLSSKGVAFGHLTMQPDGYMDFSELEGVDHDLVVRPFSQKGVFASLRQFTVNALNSHHGMQASERFGVRFTGTDDFDKDKVANEATPGDVTALVLFQAALPVPRQILSADPDRHASTVEGERLFGKVGCASCHIPALPLETTVFTEPSPFNPAGNLRPTDVARPVALDLAKLAEESGLKRDEKGRLLVPAFTDLKRHVVADDERPHFANELQSQRFVGRDEFLTARLWGLGDSAPYGHRGDLTTISEAIENHGGEANESRAAYDALPEIDRQRIIEFLLSLRLSKETPR